MKKIIYCAAVLMFVFGMANVSSAAKFTTAATTILNGVAFSPSTSVGLVAVADATTWAATAKHEAGGTTMYGLLSSDTNIKMKTGMLPGDPVAAPTSKTELGF